MEKSLNTMSKRADLKDGEVVLVAIDDIILEDIFRKDAGDIVALAESIDKLGMLQNICIDPEYRLQAGYRRLLAAKNLGWRHIEAKVFPRDLQVQHDENEVRKDFTPSERVELAEAIKRRYGNRQGQRTDQLPENIPEVSGEETRRLAAKEAGFGNETTYRQAKTVVDSGIPELVKKMDTGEVSISAAALIARQNADKQREIVSSGNVAKAAADLRKQNSSRPTLTVISNDRVDASTGEIVSLFSGQSEEPDDDEDKYMDSSGVLDFNATASNTDKAEAFFSAIRSMSYIDVPASSVVDYITNRNPPDVSAKYTMMVEKTYQTLKLIRKSLDV